MVENGKSKRPEAWDSLFENELELARANYEKEEERYKLIADKARVTFAVAGLVAAFGFTKFGDIFSVLTCTPIFLRWGAIALLSAAYFFLTSAVYISVGVIAVRDLKALSDARAYVRELYKNDKDTVNRGLASIYQRTADAGNAINGRLAESVKMAILCTKVGFITAILFFAVYAMAVWHQVCTDHSPKAGKTAPLVGSGQSKESASHSVETEARKGGETWQRETKIDKHQTERGPNSSQGKTSPNRQSR